MEFQHRLYQLRRTHGLSQEELAGRLGVTRQAVQKWEAGTSRPDMDNLVLLAREFDVTLDWLITGQTAAPEAVPVSEPPQRTVLLPVWRYEYRSRRTLWGLPLVHVKLQSRGLCLARGIIAVGNCAVGALAVGCFGIGLVSVGGLCLGLAALGGLAAGGLAAGCVSLGVVAMGGVSLGVLSIGAAAVGKYAIGGAAVATDLARGAAATAQIAIGGSPEGVSGAQTFLTDADPAAIREAIEATFPHLPEWLVRLFAGK